jgi:hypothetical protein
LTGINDRGKIVGFDYPTTPGSEAHLAFSRRLKFRLKLHCPPPASARWVCSAGAGSGRRREFVGGGLTNLSAECFHAALMGT